MLFSSQLFIYIFLPALLILYFCRRGKIWRNTILIIFSLLFYAWGEPIYVLLMIGVVAVNYAAGLLMDRTRTRYARRAVLILALVLNLGVLGYYKYTGFLVETINLIPGVSLPVPQIGLPLGISFFTFQALSYTVDVYRSSVNVQRSFFKILLYISLFPQLVAGPIVQYGDIADQLDNRVSSLEDICEGVFRFAVGLGRKVLLADTCAVAAEFFLDRAVGDSTVLGMWAGMIFFALQIYYDFSGYSDMAIGLGHIFGFTFKENFNYPYLSLSASEFWRRWHISLGTFFRDYVYIPLGGNRSHELRNLFVVWFLTGLWHGASWNFVAWGLYYGVLILLERKAIFPLYKKIGAVASRCISAVYMVFVTVIGWTIFYFEDGFSFAERIGMLFGANHTALSNLHDETYLVGHIWLLLAALLLAFPIIPAILRKFQSLFRKADTAYAVRRVAQAVFVAAILFFATARLTGNTYSPFIYSHF